MSRGDVQRAIEEDLKREQAGALGRAFEALENALRDLAEHDAASASGGARRPGDRRDLVRAAGERLWYLVIQREAVGLSRHEVVYDVLRVPTEVRSSMGPVFAHRPRRR